MLAANYTEFRTGLKSYLDNNDGWVMNFSQFFGLEEVEKDRGCLKRTPTFTFGPAIRALKSV